MYVCVRLIDWMNPSSRPTFALHLGNATIEGLAEALPKWVVSSVHLDRAALEVAFPSCMVGDACSTRQQTNDINRWRQRWNMR